MKVIYKNKVSKAGFRIKLIGFLGVHTGRGAAVGCSIHHVRDFEIVDGQKVSKTLYYLDGVHVGTWSKGEGTIFIK
jgi:hypothetical protein